MHQGITTVVTGQCGLSPAPLAEEHKKETVAIFNTMLPPEASMPWDEMSSFVSFLDYLEQIRIITNYRLAEYSQTVQFHNMSAQCIIRSVYEDAGRYSGKSGHLALHRLGCDEDRDVLLVQPEGLGSSLDAVGEADAQPAVDLQAQPRHPALFRIGHRYIPSRPRSLRARSMTSVLSYFLECELLDMKQFSTLTG